MSPLGFTTADARNAGRSSDALRAAVHRGELERLWRGFYRVRGLELRDRAIALQQWRSDAVVSHGTAAAILNCTERVGRMHVTLPPVCGLRSRSGALIHRQRLAPDEIVDVSGVRCTSPMRTLVDCARVLPLPDAVAIGDAALNLRLIEPEQLRCAVESLPRVRGVGKVESALTRCRLGAQSPRETGLRLICTAGGLPEPALQVPVWTRFGWCYGDLGWQEQRVCAEYDGRMPHSDPQQFVRDRQRWRGMEEAGWRVLPFTAADLATPATVIAEIRAALTGQVFRDHPRNIP